MMMSLKLSGAAHVIIRYRKEYLLPKKKAKPIENAFLSPRIKHCAFCKGSFDLNGYGWTVNGNKALFCSSQCHWDNYQRSERIKRGEATWEDIK